jgi:hypothetical protein
MNVTQYVLPTVKAYDILSIVGKYANSLESYPTTIGFAILV